MEQKFHKQKELTVIIDNLLDSAEALMRYAQAAGASDASVAITQSQEKSVTVRDGEIDNLTISGALSCSLRVFVDERGGKYETTSLHDDDLRLAANRAVDSATVSAENKHARLAHPHEWYREGDSEVSKIELDQLDPGRHPSVGDLMDLAFSLDEVACAYPGVSRSEGSTYSFAHEICARLTSHGFVGVVGSTTYSKSATVIAESLGLMKSETAYHMACYLEDLRSDVEVARRAGEYAVGQLGAGTIKGGIMPVLFDKRVSRELLGGFFDSIDGELVYLKSTFLLNHLGGRLFRPEVRIIEQPHLRRQIDSRLYDRECVKATPWTLVDGGIPQMWATNIEFSSRLGIPASSGHASGSSNLLLCPTPNSRDSMIRGIRSGFLVTELMGGGLNIETGAYSIGAEGYLIEGGEITRAVNKVTIAGNMLEMMRSMHVADDCSDCPLGINAPSILIDRMTVG